jgi:endoglucanase
MNQALKFFNLSVTVLAVCVFVSACGGGAAEAPLNNTPAAAAINVTDTTTAIDPATIAAVSGKTFDFPNGIPALGTTGATSLTITNSTIKTFDVKSAAGNYSGTFGFGSCIFNVKNSTLASVPTGTIITVLTCNLTAATNGQIANGSVVNTPIVLVLGTLSSSPVTLPVAVSTTGQVTINGVSAAPAPAPAPVANNLLSNGDFSNGIAGWSGNARNIVTEGGNSFNLANVATAGNAFDVNLSNVVNIPTQGVRYKLSFKASSNRARTLVAGIGLNQDPFTADVKTVNLTTAQQTFEVFLTSNFANANSRVIFDMGADTGTVVIDDVVLVLDTSTPPPAAGGPTAAAPLPTAAVANVTSIFSDSYTNLTVGAFGPDFGPFSSRITDGVIAGNNFKTMDVTAGKTFGAVSFAPSKFNATAFTTFHMDYWIDTPIPAGQVLSIKLSNHDGATPGETSAIQSTVTNITGGSWQRISIPLNSFEQAATSLSRNNIAEIIITAARANTAEPVKVHFDNMYFSR